MLTKGPSRNTHLPDVSRTGVGDPIVWNSLEYETRGGPKVDFCTCPVEQQNVPLGFRTHAPGTSR